MKTELHFKVDKYLESRSESSAQACLKTFLGKGGKIFSLSPYEKIPQKIEIEESDVIFPICSGGFCRSQALWQVIHGFGKSVELVAPHAARYGWDPYNGEYNREKNLEREQIPDAFKSYFKTEKRVRIGFENDESWEKRRKEEDPLLWKEITNYYDRHLFSVRSSRRVYIAFGRNAHIVLYRLNQVNRLLSDTVVYAIDCDDLISDPPDFLKTTPRSVVAYDYFMNLISDLFVV